MIVYHGSIEILKKSGCNAFEKVFGFWSRVLSYDL